jgi:hypothetical protein
MYTNEEIIEIYQEILDRKRDKFPRRFWSHDVKRKQCVVLVKYLMTDILNCTTKECIINNLKTPTIRKYKLAGMLKYVYYHQMVDLIKDSYPEYSIYEFKNLGKFWCRDGVINLEHCIGATKWLLEEKLKWSEDDIKEKFNGKVLSKNGFSGLLKWGWNGETYRMLEICYPNKFKVWELKSMAFKEYNFSQDEAILIIKNFIEEMGWDTDEKIKKNWRARNLSKLKMYSFIKCQCKTSLFDTIDKVYPRRFKKSDFPLPVPERRKNK